jgi:hypothetical protein
MRTTNRNGTCVPAMRQILTGWQPSSSSSAGLCGWSYRVLSRKLRVAKSRSGGGHRGSARYRRGSLIGSTAWRCILSSIRRLLPVSAVHSALAARGRAIPWHPSEQDYASHALTRATPGPRRRRAGLLLSLLCACVASPASARLIISGPLPGPGGTRHPGGRPLAVACLSPAQGPEPRHGPAAAPARSKVRHSRLAHLPGQRGFHRTQGRQRPPVGRALPGQPQPADTLLTWVTVVPHQAARSGRLSPGSP